MLSYVIRRFIYMVIILLVVSIVAFIIIQLPPGDFLSSYIVRIESSGAKITEEAIASLRKQY
ncbi:unnamed protein product, partial [marine sediment metagenome]